MTNPIKSDGPHLHIDVLKKEIRDVKGNLSSHERAIIQMFKELHPAEKAVITKRIIARIKSLEEAKVL